MQRKDLRQVINPQKVTPLVLQQDHLVPAQPAGQKQEQNLHQEAMTMDILDPKQTKQTQVDLPEVITENPKVLNPIPLMVETETLTTQNLRVIAVILDQTHQHQAVQVGTTLLLKPTLTLGLLHEVLPPQEILNHQILEPINRILLQVEEGTLTVHRIPLHLHEAEDLLTQNQLKDRDK